MGLALTFAAALMMALIAIIGRPILVYVFLFLFIFFEEMGTGFTSFSGSFVFNQNFVDLFNLKFIEIITAAAYFPLLISGIRSQGKRTAPEKQLIWLFVGLIVLLTFLEIFLHRSANISDWRLILSGAMLFHMLVLLVNTEEKLISLFKVLVIMLSIRALIGLAAYWAGYGVMSPRGMVPFFWDSRQVDAFAFGIILLTAYLANIGGLRPKDRVLPVVLAMAMLAILILTVLLSIRRTIWFVAMLGVFLVLINSKRIKIAHFASLGFVAFIGLLLALTLPGLENFRARMGGYFASVNLFESDVASSYENEVHLDNVEKYTRIILENPSVLAFGYRGYPGEDYLSLPKKYSDKYPLGVAHNAILRTIYFYGLIGLAIYMAFYIRLFLLYRQIKKLPNNRLIKHVAYASLVLLFLEFSSALTLVPPFFTTSKGLFYTFLAAFFMRAAVFHGASNSPAQPAQRQNATIQGIVT